MLKNADKFDPFFLTVLLSFIFAMAVVGTFFNAFETRASANSSTQPSSGTSPDEVSEVFNAGDLLLATARERTSENRLSWFVNLPKKERDAWIAKLNEWEVVVFDEVKSKAADAKGIPLHWTFKGGGKPRAIARRRVDAQWGGSVEATIDMHLEKKHPAGEDDGKEYAMLVSLHFPSRQAIDLPNGPTITEYNMDIGGYFRGRELRARISDLFGLRRERMEQNETYCNIFNER